MLLRDRVGAVVPRTIDPAAGFLYTGAGAAIGLAALAATQRPTTTLVAVADLSVVGVALLRTDLAILLVVASAPVELAVTTTIGGLSLTKIAGALCFASFALYALRSRSKIHVDRSHGLGGDFPFHLLQLVVDQLENLARC